MIREVIYWVTRVIAFIASSWFHENSRSRDAPILRYKIFPCEKLPKQLYEFVTTTLNVKIWFTESSEVDRGRSRFHTLFHSYRVGRGEAGENYGCNFHPEWHNETLDGMLPELKNSSLLFKLIICSDVKSW